MTFVVTDNCIKMQHMDCVEVSAPVVIASTKATTCFKASSDAGAKVLYGAAA